MVLEPVLPVNGHIPLLISKTLPGWRGPTWIEGVIFVWSVETDVAVGFRGLLGSRVAPIGETQARSGRTSEWVYNGSIFMPACRTELRVLQAYLPSLLCTFSPMMFQSLCPCMWKYANR